MIKHPILIGVLWGSCVTFAAMLAAQQVRPVPPLQPQMKFSHNIDDPRESDDTVFYMQIEVDSMVTKFSCVKNDPVLLIDPKVIPK